MSGWNKQINQDGDTLADWAAEMLSALHDELCGLNKRLDDFQELFIHLSTQTARDKE